MAGSLGYAGRLKNKRNLGGQLGAPEYIEDLQTVRDKVQQLADAITTAQQQSKKVFFFTGAGISTSIGIPDFRSPTGIWTLKKKKRPITAPLTPFEHAKPSFTHMVIAAMVEAGFVNMVCSQNVDSLHLRSGVPRKALAELHGNCFAERCSACGHERVRDFQVETIGFKPTGRTCSRPGCSAPMIDNVLDWDSALPDDELDASIAAADTAGVCMVLGSSLQIAPANEIPLFTSESGGKLVIVNLQKTPRDRSASLILRARVDAVMALLAMRLGLTLPCFIRLDGVAVCHAALPATPNQTAPPAPAAQPALPPPTERAPEAGEGLKTEPESKPEGLAEGCSDAEESKGQGNGVGVKTEDGVQKGLWGFRLAVRSVHGQACMMPMVTSVSVRVRSGEGQGAAGCVQVLGVGCAQVGGQAGQELAGMGQVQKMTPTTAENGAAEGSEADGYVTAVTPSVSGGVPLGGLYEFSVTGVDASVTSVSCSVRLHLTEWADPDKRVVTLPEYSVSVASVTSGQAVGYPSDADVAALVDSTELCIPGQAPLQGHAKRALERGPGPEVVAKGEGASICVFASQACQMEAAAVWAAYEANPPPVVLPPPPKKKAKVGQKLTGAQAAELAAAAAGVALRRSARRGATSAVAAAAAAAASTSLEDSGSDDLE